MKFHLSLFLAFAVATFLISICTIGIINSYIITEPQNKIEIEEVFRCETICQVMYKIKDISEELYIPYKNDCTHHSYNLTRELNNIPGVKATCILGSYSHLGAHMWVKANVSGII